MVADDDAVGRPDLVAWEFLVLVWVSFPCWHAQGVGPRVGYMAGCGAAGGVSSGRQTLGDMNPTLLHKESAIACGKRNGL